MAGQVLEHQPRSVRPQKQNRRDRLIHLAAQHPDWVLGVADETWWSRLVHPALHRWTTGDPWRVVAQALPKGDSAPKALCCDGLLRTDGDAVLRRFVDGRPVSHVTTALLAWLCPRLTTERQRVLVLMWAQASWPMSQAVRTGLRAPKQPVQRHGGVRLLSGRVLMKSPWRNPLAPHGVHGPRAIVEPARLLTAAEIIRRVGDDFGGEQVEHLTQHVA